MASPQNNLAVMDLVVSKAASNHRVEHARRALSAGNEPPLKPSNPAPTLPMPVEEQILDYTYNWATWASEIPDPSRRAEVLQFVGSTMERVLKHGIERRAWPPLNMEKNGRAGDVEIEVIIKTKQKRPPGWNRAGSSMSNKTVQQAASEKLGTGVTEASKPAQVTRGAEEEPAQPKTNEYPETAVAPMAVESKTTLFKRPAIHLQQSDGGH